MKQLAWVLVAAMAVAAASDSTFARGGGGLVTGAHAAGRGGGWHAGGYANRWHGGGWHGGGLGIYVGGAWPFAYSGTFPGYSAYPMYAWNAATGYVELQPQANQVWYYCVNPAGYYPYVQTCSDVWLKVVQQR